MGSKRFSLIMVFALFLVLVLGSSCIGPDFNIGKLQATTQKLQQQTQDKLNSLDSDLAAAAVKLGRAGLSTSDARQILNDVCSKYPFLNDCVAADASGKVFAAAPDTFRKYEGADLKTGDVKKATFTKVIPTIEGIQAVSLMQPILSEKGEYAGVISALFQPESFFDAIAEPELKGTGIELNVLQTDGLNIYDFSGTDTGGNILKDAKYQEYKELVELGKRFTTQESGTGTYTYPNHTTGASTIKMAVWYSVTLHGTSWRLIDIQEASK
ncbi:MAG: hypothetical protein EHM12_06005 [Dehalococcoidia bacterium]|nr:MAG: hypothetical protein EHM12_06005 [Dehalococcoidia bacterium]